MAQADATEAHDDGLRGGGGGTRDADGARGGRGPGRELESVG